MIELSDKAVSTLTAEFDACALVYDPQGGGYTQKAVALFQSFVQSKGLPVRLVNAAQLSVSPIGERELAVYVRTEGAEKDGYFIALREKEILLSGATAQSTYYAVSRFIHLHCKNNADLITNGKSEGGYDRYEVTRAEYLADISKLPLVWEYEWTPKFLDFEEKISSFNDKNGRLTSVAHRGDMECYPENSLEGIISATRRGADAVEVDCALTKDGVYVLSHGTKLNCNTDWEIKNGKVINGVTLPTSNYIYDWTYAELLQLNLKYGNGCYADGVCKSHHADPANHAESEISAYKIATLEEAMLVAKDRTTLILDRLNYKMDGSGEAFVSSEQRGIHNIYWQDVYALIKKTGAYRSILTGNLALTLDEATPIVQILETDCGKTCPNQFLRAGFHNCVNDWFKEFDLRTQEEFNALYATYLDPGVTQGGYTTKGTFIMGNRLSRIIDWIDENYEGKR